MSQYYSDKLWWFGIRGCRWLLYVPALTGLPELITWHKMDAMYFSLYGVSCMFTSRGATWQAAIRPGLGRNPWGRMGIISRTGGRPEFGWGDHCANPSAGRLMDKAGWKMALWRSGGIPFLPIMDLTNIMDFPHSNDMGRQVFKEDFPPLPLLSVPV